MNNNYQFFYETQIFNRNFLNCSQRQAFLHLDSKGYDIAQLFGYCLLDFDTIFLQMVEQPIPRYDFVCDGLSTNKLHKIGINRTESYFEDYRFAKEFIQNNLDQTPCIQIECDVFNVPHRKEYQNRIHIQHFITILDYKSENDIWVVYDDLTNGDLKIFEFSEEYLSFQFNLSKNKSIRLFEDFINKEKNTDDFYLNKSYNCFNQLINLDLFNNNLLIKIKNFFLIYLGSRQCFQYYCRKKNINDNFVLLENIIHLSEQLIKKINLWLSIKKGNSTEYTLLLNNILQLDKEIKIGNLDESSNLQTKKM